MGQMVVHVFGRSEKSREQWLRDHHGRGWESKRGLVRCFDLLSVDGKLCPAVEWLVADHTGQKKALPEHRSSRRVCSAARRDRRGRQSTAVAPTTLRQVDDRQALNRMPGSIANAVANAVAISARSDARPRIANSKQSGRRMFGGGKGSC